MFDYIWLPNAGNTEMYQELVIHLPERQACKKFNFEPWLGAVLYQHQDGHKRVIANARRSVSQSESRYPAHKLEMLALKWAVCDKFKDYLLGS